MHAWPPAGPARRGVQGAEGRHTKRRRRRYVLARLTAGLHNKIAVVTTYQNRTAAATVLVLLGAGRVVAGGPTRTTTPSAACVPPRARAELLFITPRTN
jgi:hypothetical protein